MNDRLTIKVKGTTRKEVAMMLQRVYDSIKFMPHLIYSSSNIELQKDGATYVGAVTYRDPN